MSSPLMAATSAFLHELWQAVGAEITIFTVTLSFALAIRSLSNAKLAAIMRGKHHHHPPKSVELPPKMSPKISRGGSETLSRMSSVSSRETDTIVSGSRMVAPPAPRPAQRAPRSTAAAGKRRRAAAELFREIVDGSKEQTGIKFAHRVLQVYHEELLPAMNDAGTDIKRVAGECRCAPADLYSVLVNCAVRVGKYHFVESFCEDMSQQGVQRSLSFYESAMRQLASQKQYHLALTMYDWLDRDGLRPSPITCSCLVGFAAEVGELQRAIDFFESLSQVTTPSIRAYMTVLRVHARRQDFASSLAIMQDMEARGVPIDSLVLNIILATCVAADQLHTVEDLVNQGDQRKPPTTDIVSYNTYLKACAQRGDVDRTLVILARIKARGLHANAITLNTAMDVMVRGGRPAECWKLVKEMHLRGVVPDKFTCSIIVKGLGRSSSPSEVRAALALLRDYGCKCDSALKTTLYHTILEAASQVGEASGDRALVGEAFAQMRAAGVMASQLTQRLVGLAPTPESKLTKA